MQIVQVLFRFTKFQFLLHSDKNKILMMLLKAEKEQKEDDDE